MEDEVKNETQEAVTETPADESKEEVKAVPVKAEKVEPGMVVRVHQKIKEMTPKGEERERIQIFEGTVIAVKGQDARSRSITVRKIASGVGVERIFPVLSPVIAKIEVMKSMKVRRAKLYFMRDNKKKKLKEKKA